MNTLMNKITTGPVKNVSTRQPLSITSAANATAKKAKKAKNTAGEFCYGLPGNTAPFGDFDPLNLSKGKDENTIKRYREAELTHGRVAMVASVGFIVGENFNPLFDGAIKGPAINHFQQVPTGFWVGVLGAIAFVELARAQRGWVPPGQGKGASWIEGPFFELREGYTPGAVGWDPLGLAPTTKEEFNVMQTRELNNGRLAMFGILGSIVQEEVTGLELFNLQDDGLLNDANCVGVGGLGVEGTVCEILEKSG